MHEKLRLDIKQLQSINVVYFNVTIEDGLEVNFDSDLFSFGTLFFIFPLYRLFFSSFHYLFVV